MSDYIKDIRGKVGHMPIILNAVAGVVVNDEHKILLQERTDTHNWSLPGGYMEYGETFLETLNREMKEDSGLKVEVVDMIGTFEQGFTTYPNGDQAQVISRLYLVEPAGGSLLKEQTDETLSLKYFSFSDLPPLLNQQNMDMIKAAAKYFHEEF
ncbi:NUDIX hydrolase [Ligilactobacillus acidipiscis]|uniref:NUDIX hydrolase n=2 Tax=Ligilactobacillus acidipiscis TaxID=89059 RepID=A0A921FBH6_9LACO|nr:NUDIX hydrolase [Ligilactobacillus acidipiscis]GAW64276.1 ADP-ribose pyrophosphatase [Ligilactobacillus acidipiscis]GEN20193.1 ADP-ribose pyrophosphatase [Ligilactobacillus acidipiscis]HJE98147.1 NUDIX hydrolase [Ligilactobacillus acidipiscis]